MKIIAGKKLKANSPGKGWAKKETNKKKKERN